MKTLAKIIAETEALLEPEEAPRRRQGPTLEGAIASHLRRRFGIHDGGVLANPEPTEALLAVRAFGDSKARILVLCGGVGTGKSLAAADMFVAPFRGIDPSALEAAGSEWERVVCPVAGSWVSAPKLARAIDPWRHELDAGHEPIDPSRGVSVLDDLGTEGDSQRFQEALATYIDARMDAPKTVITTNLAKADIRKRYGDRIADRLNHVGACVELKGKSMRRKVAGF